MKFKQLHHIFFLSIIFLLPSCGRVIDWTASNFYQGEERTYDRSILTTYLRSKRVYDQLHTVAMFDALWLSPAVRTVYADMVSAVYGKNEEHHNAFLRRQLEEERHFISFYVLSTYGIPLGDSKSQWVVTLRINGISYTPIEFKAVELPLEYKSMFGDRLNRFKLPYLIKFDARDVEEHELLEYANEIELVFRSVDREAVLMWKVNGKNNTGAQEVEEGVWGLA
jgi:hypothetical protein